MTQSSNDALNDLSMSAGLKSSIQRAVTYAYEQAHPRVTLEHLLLALSEDKEAAPVLSASRVDVTQLSADVSDFLGRLEDRVRPDGARDPVLGSDVKQIIQSAGAAARKGKRSSIGSALVLAAIVGDGRSPAANILRNRGLTFDQAIEALKKRGADSETTSQQVIMAPPPQPAQPATPSPTPSRNVPARNAPGDDAPVNAAAPSVRTPVELAASRPATAKPIEPKPTTATGQSAQDEPAADLRGAHSRAVPSRDTKDLLADVRARIAASREAAIPGIAPLPKSLAKDADAPTSQSPDTQPSRAPDTATPSPRETNQPSVRPVRLDRANSGQANQPRQAGSRSAQPRPSAPANAATAPTYAAENGVPVARTPSLGASTETNGSSPITADSLATRLAKPPAAGAQGRPHAHRATRSQPQPPVARDVTPQPAARNNATAAARPSVAATPPAQNAPSQPREATGRTTGRRDASLRSDAMDHGDRDAGRPTTPTTRVAANGVSPAMPSAPMPTPRAPQGVAAPVQEAPAPSVTGPSTTSGPPLAPRHARPIDPEKLLDTLPRRLTHGHPVTVEIRAPRAGLDAWGINAEQAESNLNLVITKAMGMRLRAPDGGLTIEPASPETQWSEGFRGPLSDDVVSWRWTVTARRSGIVPIQLCASTRVVGKDGLAAERPLPDQTVDIRVTPDFVAHIKFFSIVAGAFIAGAALTYFQANFAALSEFVTRLFS